MPNGSNKEAKYYVNGEEAGKLFGDETDTIQNLGYHEEGETIYVKVEFDEGRVSLNTKSPLFFQINQEQFEATFNELNAGEMNITDFSDTSFKGTIKAEANEIVMTTIPYDQYWKVFVDGERVETYKVLDCLLAFDISEGEHTIEMKYSSKVFNIGLILGFIGLNAFVVMCVFEKKFREKMGYDKQIEDSENISEPLNELENENKTDKEDKNDDLSC
jgi:uncharacterized membrane protein YfhO